jgi:nucleotide-binding universal stress UspA family protein
MAFIASPTTRFIMFQRILLATDGSDASDHAARLAVDLARAHAAKLTALFVVDPYPFLGVGEINPLGFDAYMNAARGQAAQAHDRVLEICKTGGAAVPVVMQMVEDATVLEGVLRTAREQQSDLIVIGSHGRSGIARMMLGSIAAKVVAQSPVPVLVAR